MIDCIIFPIDIECLQTTAPRVSPNDSDIAEGIQRVTTFVRGNVITMNAKNSPAWVSRIPNQFTHRRSKMTVTHPSLMPQGITSYSMAPFVLGPEQALVIRGRFPSCRFSNVVLFNRFLQTLDYEERTVSLNRTQTVLEEDGSFSMIIAHKDPGRPNWLDTEGRPLRHCILALPIARGRYPASGNRGY